MKKLFFILIPSLIFGVIVFLLFRLFTGGASEKGALQVTSIPESKVYLNGMLIGQTPLCKCEEKDMLKTGEHTIRLVPNSTEFSEFQGKITITKSILTVVDRRFEKGGSSEGSVITLEQLKDEKAVEIYMVSFPGQVEVFLDGNTVGLTPLTIRDVAESDHSVKFSKDGYKDKVIRIKTAVGYKLTARVYLGVSDLQITPTPLPTASPSAALKPLRVTILQTPTGFLRVRSTNAITASEIGRVTPGESFPLTGEAAGWYEILLQDGKKGWISSEYAEITEDD